MHWRIHLARRLALAIITVFFGGLVSAALARFAPGYGADERLLDAHLNHDSVQAIRYEQAAEPKVFVFYTDALRRMVRGDLGTSRVLHRPVSELLSERYGVSLRLITVGLTASWAMAGALVLAFWFADNPILGSVSEAGTCVLMCLPIGAVALLIVFLNGSPFLAIAAAVFPKLYRYLHTLLRVTKGMPHVVTARAQGAGSARLLFWHIIPNVQGEMLALFGVSVSVAIGATIPVEALCGMPGLGQLAWQAALGRDLPLLIHLSVLVVACTVLANAGADLLSEHQRESE